MDIKALQADIHKNAVNKGFWEEVNIGEKLALIHSEVSEALEDYRAGKMNIRYREDGKPEGFPVELADIIIRVLDLAEYFKINLLPPMLEKHAYNETRPYKHGKKC